MKSLPARTAELRANLVELADSPTHQKVMAGMAESMMRTYTAGSSVSQQMMEITSHLRRDAVMSELFTMSPEMMDLIEHSSKSLPPQIMVEQDLPAPFGLLHLPKELKILDVRGENLHVTEIMWSKIMIGDTRTGLPRPAIRMVVFTRLGGPSDRIGDWLGKEKLSRYLTEVPEMSVVFARDLAFQDKATTVICTSEGVDPAEKARLVYQYIANVEAEHITDVHQSDNGAFKTIWRGHTFLQEADPFVQFLKAYFHFCNSTLTTLEREDLPRSMGRWLRRIGLPTGPVTVVTLRKTAHSPSTHPGWELTYRYVRRGHWRAQWYGSGEHKYQQYIWISPTIVGPDDGPLRVRDVVNVVRR
jgi:hypothetical protein